MATLLSALITKVRVHLNEPSARFWSDTELLGHMNAGIRDLKRAISDLFQDYFLTVDTTHVTMPASTGTLSGVPADVGVVRSIEPASLSTYPYVRFEYRRDDHKDMVSARAQGTIDTNSVRLIYYSISGAGAPVAAPTIRVAPMISATMAVRLAYDPSLAELTAASTNPIPGELDHGVICWTVAHAQAKQRPDRMPDPGWLAMYANEKKNAMVSLAPRQTQTEIVAEALFEELW